MSHTRDQPRPCGQKDCSQGSLVTKSQRSPSATARIWLCDLTPFVWIKGVSCILELYMEWWTPYSVHCRYHKIRVTHPYHKGFTCVSMALVHDSYDNYNRKHWNHVVLRFELLALLLLFSAFRIECETRRQPLLYMDICLRSLSSATIYKTTSIYSLKIPNWTSRYVLP